MIAIETKFHGPTNHKPSRFSATCTICRKHNYVSKDHGLSQEAEHKRAADAHLEKYHRTFDVAGELHACVMGSECYETRAGYVFPLIPCEPY